MSKGSRSNPQDHDSNTKKTTFITASEELFSSRSSRITKLQKLDRECLVNDSDYFHWCEIIVQFMKDMNICVQKMDKPHGFIIKTMIHNWFLVLELLKDGMKSQNAQQHVTSLIQRVTEMTYSDQDSGSPPPPYDPSSYSYPPTSQIKFIHPPSLNRKPKGDKEQQKICRKKPRSQSLSLDHDRQRTSQNISENEQISEKMRTLIDSRKAREKDNRRQRSSRSPEKKAGGEEQLIHNENDPCVDSSFYQQRSISMSSSGRRKWEKYLDKIGVEAPKPSSHSQSSMDFGSSLSTNEDELMGRKKKKNDGNSVSIARSAAQDPSSLSILDFEHAPIELTKKAALINRHDRVEKVSNPSKSAVEKSYEESVRGRKDSQVRKTVIPPSISSQGRKCEQKASHPSIVDENCPQASKDENQVIQRDKKQSSKLLLDRSKSLLSQNEFSKSMKKGQSKQQKKEERMREQSENESKTNGQDQQVATTADTLEGQNFELKLDDLCHQIHLSISNNIHTKITIQIFPSPDSINETNNPID